MIDFFFADDARQSNPSRRGMGPLVGIGGIHVAAEEVGDLERNISKLCDRVGFPPGEQFKYSPGKRESFMRSKLVGDARREFYEELFDIAKVHGAIACVVIEDTSRNTARKSSTSHEHDVTSLFLERADWALAQVNRSGVVVVAKPGGAGKSEEKFLSDCLTVLEEGTEYTELKRIPLPVMTAPSRNMRLLQLADVVASCTVARVSGEKRYSPDLFALIKPILRRDVSRIGGIGVKIHPDFNYANLYHWILGDKEIWRRNSGWQLPMSNFDYYADSGE